jgi:flavodoxin
MKYKMRILHFSPKGNAQRIAEGIGRSQKVSSDQIPPAYPVEGEKLLFIGVELKGSKADKAVLNFCKDMSTARAKNVAFYGVGSSFEGIAELKKILSDKGINVAGSYECKVGGGLFGGGKLSDEDVKAAVDWADKLVDSLA